MQKALLFIPDISGFTEFVHHTDIKHSGHIISELLELLIDTNTTGLKLAEIEGDALFFYKNEEPLELSQLKAQINSMYLAFHSHLKRYEYERICQCGACSSAYNLEIKFIVHYGEIDFIKVKDSHKPFGSNVIQIHRLLKNEVPLPEYALFTKPILDFNKSQEAATNLVATYDFGEIEYNYQGLAHLKDELPYIDPIPQEVPKHKLFVSTEMVNLPILELYEVISNFDYRLLWVKGVDTLEYDKNKVNRAGQKHRCLIAKTQVANQITVTKKAEEGQFVYGESTTSIPLTKQVNVYYVLENNEPGLTKLNIEVYADFKLFGRLLKSVLSKKLEKNLTENIKDLILLIDSGFTINKNTTNENA